MLFLCDVNYRSGFWLAGDRDIRVLDSTEFSSCYYFRACSFGKKKVRPTQRPESLTNETLRIRHVENLNS